MRQSLPHELFNYLGCGNANCDRPQRAGDLTRDSKGCGQASTKGITDDQGNQVRRQRYFIWHSPREALYALDGAVKLQSLNRGGADEPP
jgi:hypothetical protein